MDWSIVLGILGIVVSLIVGWVSSRIAAQRSRNQKYRTAKAVVLQELSKSLGEDSIPTPAIIQATMRSVLRESGDPKVEIDVDEVLDDLMRQVTADPFLDGERRQKLQGDIEQVRAEARNSRIQLSREEAREAAYQRSSALPSLSTLVGVLTTVITASAMVALALESLPQEARESALRGFLESEEQEEWRWVLAFLMTSVLLFLFLGPIGDDAFERIREFFRRKRD